MELVIPRKENLLQDAKHIFSKWKICRSLSIVEHELKNQTRFIILDSALLKKKIDNYLTISEESDPKNIILFMNKSIYKLASVI